MAVRHRNDTHQHLMGTAKLLQLVHVQNRLAILSMIAGRICIECGQHIQAIFFESPVTHQRLTQTASTDQDCIGGIIIAEELLDIFDQTFT